MDRGNVLSGAAFTTALISAVTFLAVLIVTGVLAYRYVQQTMSSELEEQIVAEQIMLENIYRQDGAPALIRTLADLQTAVIGRRALGLFDVDGTKLAGNLGVAPEFVGWSSQPFTVTYSWLPKAEATKTELYYAHASGVGNLTLVVGRSLATIRSTERALFRALAIAGFVVTLTMLGAGFFISRKSLRKLERLESTLAKVSDGDIAARMTPSPDNDQIDRIAARMNTHLDSLSRLMISTRATAASVAHDLKTPMSRAYLGLGRALDLIERGDDARETIEDIQAELSGMNGIVDMILRLSRIEARADGARFAPVDLGAMLDDLAETYQVVAEENGQSFRYDRPQDERFEIVGDAPMLRQMIVNLIQNAVTHSASGDAVSVRLEHEAGHIRLTVADTGPGIPKEEREAVFEPFHRLELNRNSAGSGLGLALVRAIAVRHGAAIALVDNAPGLRVVVDFG